jgi:hypothetical protein
VTGIQQRGQGDGGKGGRTGEGDSHQSGQGLE